ncbi:uncharacterized protein AB675_11863 [Cyphellophora attinorum]|uniref:Major facilitator superfamily (MFS) profile domain-containing protein n=1 Tax=Cyphellophora attinorum TaxID=1664694 RepID=A0A0N1H486_9EURO|nr:uncharacterized protein AB675_11863 [Phialophora attinorum]KPI36766.1 hypothetical protein AB675_11863 [Phialophora attinorum]
MCIYTGLANIRNLSTGVQWASVVVLILFQLVNGASWIWLAFLYAVEILPLQYRSQVQASSNTVYWFLAFIAAYFGGQGAADPNVGAKVYITFCITGGIITVLAWLFVVETKDLTLEEIDLLWAEPEYIASRQQNVTRGVPVTDKKEFDVEVTTAPTDDSKV